MNDALTVFAPFSGATISCEYAPPSVQPVNVQNASSKPCGVSAANVNRDLASTLCVNGVRCVSLPSDTRMPCGLLLTVTSASRGSRRTVFDVRRPSASTAVNVSSRCAGHSWLGVTKEPWSTPA